MVPECRVLGQDLCLLGDAGGRSDGLGSERPSSSVHLPVLGPGGSGPGCSGNELEFLNGLHVSSSGTAGIIVDSSGTGGTVEHH